MWAFIQDGQIQATYSKLPKNGADGTNLYSLKKIGNLYDVEGNVVIDNYDFGTDYEALKQYGYYKVIEESEPEYNNETHQKPVMDLVFLNDEVVQVWTVNLKTEEQITAEISAAWDSIKNTRNQLLKQSDWTQLADVHANPAWVVYRQTLRDITELFDTPDAVIWPEKPQ